MDNKVPEYKPTTTQRYESLMYRNLQKMGHFIHTVPDVRGKSWDFTPWRLPQYDSGVLRLCFIPSIQYFNTDFMKEVKKGRKEEAKNHSNRVDAN
jgi:hypothetical protein